MSDIDDKLRELVLGGQAYQARELAHSLDLADWADLLDLLLDHYCYIWLRFVARIHTPEQEDRIVELARGRITGQLDDPMDTHPCEGIARLVWYKNPDIRERVIAEAAA